MKQTTSRLVNKVRRLSKHFVSSKGVVLMYHRISNSYPDPWDLNVSETNFKAHLQLFKSRYNVLPLNEFDELRKIGQLPERALAITFDDGYVDNVLLAAPMMNEAKLPATFYVCTETLGNETGMWWDTLAQIVFGSHALPNSEKLDYENQIRQLVVITSNEELSNNIDVSKRVMGVQERTSLVNIYMHLWKVLQPMPVDKQTKQLEFYNSQINSEVISTYPMMRESDVRCLSGHSLFEIGAHTRNHIQLSAHSYDYQKLEIEGSVEYLQELTGNGIRSLSYPFGLFNRDTLDILKQMPITVACTTLPQVATRIDDSFLLPRVMVKDVTANSLESQIEAYF